MGKLIINGQEIGGTLAKLATAISCENKGVTTTVQGAIDEINNNLKNKANISDLGTIPDLGIVNDLNEVQRTSICIANSNTLNRPDSGSNNYPIITIMGESNIGWGTYSMGIQIAIVNNVAPNTSYYRVKYANSWYDWGRL